MSVAYSQANVHMFSLPMLHCGSYQRYEKLYCYMCAKSTKEELRDPITAPCYIHQYMRDWQNRNDRFHIVSILETLEDCTYKILQEFTRIGCVVAIHGPCLPCEDHPIRTSCEQRLPSHRVGECWRAISKVTDNGDQWQGPIARIIGPE